jgi:D-alanyl-lipoteichoic acid acyltransferase DltB (MBOAT superfamily)
MAILHTAVFTAFALLAGWLLPQRWRIWALLTGSLLAVYWLQPSSPIRHLDFWLPSASIGLTIFVWAVTNPRSKSTTGQNRAAALVVLVSVVLVGILRYLGPLCCLTPTPPPQLAPIILALGLGAAIIAIPYYFAPGKRIFTAASIVAMLAIFITLKAGTLGSSASGWLRSLTGQPTELASALDISWLGFSYLAFRLLHVLRDSQQGRLPAYTLSEFAVYALFFPTYTAGPIDRVQRFTGDLRNPVHSQPQEDSPPGTEESVVPRSDYGNLLWGGRRILMGVFKKFVLADSLALIALSGQNAGQLSSGLWAWVLLYAYALRIYFDFSGYTDVALGLGRLLGFNLPENFDRPYLKQNLTVFWNSWHITLAQWFRAYYFNPLTRYLRTRPWKPPVWAIVLLGQISTMLLIGLWHGITWNFAIWGAWHGLGLFIHNRWSAWARPRLEDLDKRPRLQRTLQAGGWFLTFHYVTLGWVWFALPDTQMALKTFQTLAGF